MQELLIMNCTDQLMWYAKMIGQYVVFLKEDDDYYWSREPDGFSNIVLKKDAVVVTKATLF